MIGELRRFSGALVAMLLALAAIGGVWWTSRPAPPPPPPPAIFRFEKEDLVAFKVDRSDGTVLSFHQRPDGQWEAPDLGWRPSRSMVRRVAHQLHQLAARAEVVKEPGDPALYGLGPDAIRVHLALRDGGSLDLEVGDPNPSSVSWYVRAMPSGTVFIVAKAAVDYFRLPLDSFREDRFATLDADDARAITAVIDGNAMSFERVDEKRWEMLTPTAQPADRDQVRTLLGRVAALRAERFVQDGREGLAALGLDPPRSTISIAFGSAEPVNLWVGDPVEASDPPQVYVYRQEDDATYAARAGFLETWRLSPEAFRDRALVRRSLAEVESATVTVGAEAVTITRSADDWRWPGGGAAPGATPGRVVAAAVGLRARAFPEPEPPDAGMEAPLATVDLAFAGGERTRILLGSRWTIEVDPGPPPPARPGEPPRPSGPRTQARQWVTVGTSGVVEIDGALFDLCEDLVREFRRERQREAERDWTPQ